MSCDKSQYSQLAHYCWAYFLNGNSDHSWLFMAKEFAAYFDDSGHPDNHDLVLVAGFLSTKDQWLQFEEEWGNCLVGAGLPRNTVFHMTDFMVGQAGSPFEGWGDDRKHRLLDALVHVLAVRTRKHFSEHIIMGDYRDVNARYPLEEGVGAPYAIAGRNILFKTNQWLKAYDPQARLITFFEDGTKHKGDLMDCCLRDGIAIPVFAKKEEMAPLQAADLLAWEVAKNLRAINRSSVSHSLDYYLEVLFKRNWERDDDGTFRAQHLEELCTMQSLPLRRDLPERYRFVHHSLPKKPRRRTIF